MTDIFIKLRRIAAEVTGVPVEDISPEDSMASLTSRGAPSRAALPAGSEGFVAGLGMDSLNLVEFVVWVEEEFGVEIQVSEAHTFATKRTTLGELAARIDQGRNGA